MGRIGMAVASACIVWAMVSDSLIVLLILIGLAAWLAEGFNELDRMERGKGDKW